ncbi:MAG: DUF1269 domain-containing protein [Chloroflexota bacterium]
MNDLIVVAFDHLEDAETAMERLRKLEKAGHIAFEDTALVRRDPDGTTHVDNEVSGTTEKAAVVGAVVGGLVTFVFPPAGAAIGAALGAAVGVAMKSGVDNKFVDEVKSTLKPGRSAIFLIVKGSHTDAVVAALREYRGDLVQTTLDTDAEEALRRALD